MIRIYEPNWGVNVVTFLYTYMHKHEILARYMPILADIFVFSYPIYLVFLYLYGIGKQKDYYKQASLYIFFSGFGAVFINILIQVFVYKDRPDIVLQLIDGKRDYLPLKEYLPTSSFPSDHAAMSMAIAMASLAWGVRYKNRKFVWFGAAFGLFSLIMSFSRVMIGIHRPTDIIVGIIIGAFVPLILLRKKIFYFLTSWFIEPIIRFQKRLWKKLFGYTA